MKNYQPYKTWTRDRIFENIKETCIQTGNEDCIEEYRMITYDERWDPIKNYNGCNVIQDRLHIFPACYKHDWNWMVNGGGIETDREFRRDCIKFGSTPCEARKNFIGVRIGWIIWFKWDKMWKRYKKNKLK